VRPWPKSDGALCNQDASRHVDLPTTYAGETFPSRRALAAHLARLTGRSVSTVEQFLSRNGGDAEAFVAHARSVQADSRIPTTYDGRTFPSRTALAEYLAPLLGRPWRSVEQSLCETRGDAELLVARASARAARSSSVSRAATYPVTFEDEVFTSRNELAKRIAPRLGRTTSGARNMLRSHGDDPARVFAVAGSPLSEKMRTVAAARRSHRTPRL
jgi:hypothetical protein